MRAVQFLSGGTLGRTMNEHEHQKRLFQWAAVMQDEHPELEMMYAVPNGGKRNLGVAKKLKAEGVRAGVLDINLDVARGGCHGMRIEMKVKPNKLTETQKIWVERYTRQGYSVAICYGWMEAREVILRYLEG